MFIIFRPCMFWHEMIYYHGVLDSTEMCSEIHYTLSTLCWDMWHTSHRHRQGPFIE
jgi:hypothetical protein